MRGPADGAARGPEDRCVRPGDRYEKIVCMEGGDSVIAPPFVPHIELRCRPSPPPARRLGARAEPRPTGASVQQTLATRPVPYFHGPSEVAFGMESVTTQDDTTRASMVPGAWTGTSP